MFVMQEGGGTQRAKAVAAPAGQGCVRTATKVQYLLLYAGQD